MPSTDERFDDWKRRPGRETLSFLLESVDARVQRICRRVLRDAHDAEEAKQEVLLEIASGLSSVLDAVHFDRWVGRVAYRTAADRRRMRLRRRSHEFKAAAGRTSNGKGHDRALHEAMARLGEEERDLLIERYFDRQTLQEMAERRGFSVGAVRKRIEKAREKLKRKLGGAFPLVLWKLGAVVMKSKTAAAVAVIAFPFLLLGGGVWVAATKKPAGARDFQPPGRDSGRVGLSEHFGAASMARFSPMATGSPASSLDARIAADAPWSRLLVLVDRIAVSSKRIPELKHAARHSLTEEESRRLQIEAADLEAQVEADFRELHGLASGDPRSLFEFLIVRRHHVIHFALEHKVREWMDSEFESEESPGGVLVKGLVKLAQGTLEEKIYFGSLIRFSVRLNREVGQAGLGLLNESEDRIRRDVMAALSFQARRGNLRSLISDNLQLLKATALGDRDLLTRACALESVAFQGTADTDEFVLQRFESCASEADLVAVLRALDVVHSRVSVNQTARYKAAFSRATSLLPPESSGSGLWPRLHSLRQALESSGR